VSSIFVEFRVHKEFEQKFLAATRKFELTAKSIPGLRRIEIFKLRDGPCDFVLRLTCADESALEALLLAPDTQRWIDSVQFFIQGQPSIRRASLLSPALPPRPPSPPVLETARHGQGRRPQRLRLPRLEIALERVEIAAEHDGPLRGRADPCVVVGCFLLRADRSEILLGRAIYRVELDQDAPCELVRTERLLDVPVHHEDIPARLALLVLAFEENGGTDVHAAYRDLADHERLLVWWPHELEPNPTRLAEFSPPAPGVSDPVHVLFDRRPLAESTDDSLVGASLAVVEFVTTLDERVVRPRTRSSDGLNDWRFELRLQIEPVID
jgi:quinol monooxygenase YgiN